MCYNWEITYSGLWVTQVLFRDMIVFDLVFGIEYWRVLSLLKNCGIVSS